MGWKTIKKIIVYRCENRKGENITDHIDVQYVIFDNFGGYRIETVSLKGKQAEDILEKYINRSNMSFGTLLKNGSLEYIDKDALKEETESEKNSRELLNKIGFIGPDNYPQKSIVSNLKLMLNKKVLSLIAAGVILVVGVKYLTSKKTYQDIVTYRNPDKRVELSYDEDVINNFEKAKDVFGKLIEEEYVNNEDVDFLASYFENAGRTNSDPKLNNSFTEFNTSTALFNASKNKRNDIVNSMMGSMLARIELDYNGIFRPSMAFNRVTFDENRAYEYFIYINSLLNGGETTNYKSTLDNTRSYHVATEEESSIFKSSITPLEKLIVYARLKGFLSGEYEFKYKRDIVLSSFNLASYKKDEYIKLLDAKIESAKNDLKNQNMKISRRKR